MNKNIGSLMGMATVRDIVSRKPKFPNPHFLTSIASIEGPHTHCHSVCHLPGPNCCFRSFTCYHFKEIHFAEDMDTIELLAFLPVIHDGQRLYW